MPAKKLAKKKPKHKQAASGSASSPSAKSKTPSTWRARIRMYRQGLGDCFLLTFGKEHPKHLLIDCGVILGTPNPAAKLGPVAQSILDETSGEIDILVITHEHLDHLWGFHEKMAGKTFDQIKFGQLWMAWTENPKDSLANSLRKSRQQMEEVALHAAARLKETSIRMGPGVNSSQRLNTMAKRIEDVLGFRGIDSQNLSLAQKGQARQNATSVAFDHLKERIPEKTYFQPGTGPFPLPGVDDVRFYVLGPPRSAEQLQKSAVTKSDDVFGLGGGALSMADSFLAALKTHGVETGATSEGGQPFERGYRQPPRATSVRALRATIQYDDPQQAWRQIEEDWLATGEQIALALDDATNNTSLVLAFEFITTGEVLLFVGDAQLGNWYSWDDYTWRSRATQGETEKVTAADLLRRAIFYKVGHHGSHNATLRQKGVERMTSSNLVAMIPVDINVAHNIKGWMRMPLESLIKRLSEKCACVIQLDEAEKVQGALNGRVQVSPTKLFVDYFV